MNDDAFCQITSVFVIFRVNMIVCICIGYWLYGDSENSMY